MDVDKLIRMANQIGEFFESMPDREQASRDIVTHLRRFWEPRMRQAMLDSIDRGQAEGLSAIVRAAIADHRQLLG